MPDILLVQTRPEEDPRRGCQIRLDQVPTLKQYQTMKNVIALLVLSCVACQGPAGRDGAPGRDGDGESETLHQVTRCDARLETPFTVFGYELYDFGPTVFVSAFAKSAQGESTDARFWPRAAVALGAPAVLGGYGSENGATWELRLVDGFLQVHGAAADTKGTCSVRVY
jgi:hypothetical protein